MHDIDFVLTYLDSNDEKWQIEKARYKYGEGADVNINRYRDWDNLKYFFRGIDKFAPWVRKVHVVTWGHVPSWLNLDNPKINIVNHKDYIPEEWLPTFSSRCIDMNLHRIPELSEHFVYFNDDMFLVAPVSEEDFFRDGLPCDAAVETPYTHMLRDGVSLHFAAMVNVALINKNFNKRQVFKNHKAKWFNPVYGKDMFRTLNSLPYPHFLGFMNHHIPYSYLKSTYETVWNAEPELLTKACSHHFREVVDTNHWIFTYWQYVTGNFAPRSTKFGISNAIHNIDDAKKAKKEILESKYKVMCINDAVETGMDFEEIVECVNGALEQILGEKSTFESE